MGQFHDVGFGMPLPSSPGLPADEGAALLNFAFQSDAPAIRSAETGAALRNEGALEHASARIRQRCAATIVSEPGM